MATKRQRRKFRRLKQASKDYSKENDNNYGNKNTKMKKELGTDNNTNNSGNNQQPRKEVFDSSRYDVMGDMAKGASTDQFFNKQAMTDVQKNEPLKAEEIENKSLTTAASTVSSIISASSDTKINPLISEERARTIREIIKEETPAADDAKQSMQEEGEDVKVIERGGYNYNNNSISDFIKSMTQYSLLLYASAFTNPHRYAQMMNAGVEICSQFTRNSIDMIDLWLRSFYRSWLPDI